MVKDIVQYFIYAVLDLLPLGSVVHSKLLTYYFNQPALNEDSLILVYFCMLVGLCIYFIRYLYRMMKEFLKVARLLFLGRATIGSVCSEFKMVNLMVVIVIMAVVYYFTTLIFTNVNGSMYLYCAMMIATAIIIRVTHELARIKVNGKIIGPLETVILSFAQALSFIPGFSRVANITALGKFMGTEKKHIADLVLLSFIPILIIQILFINSDINILLEIINSNLLVFFIVTTMVLLSLEIIILILCSPSFYKFYYYLAGVGVWTILDLFFSKRGL